MLLKRIHTGTSTYLKLIGREIFINPRVKINIADMPVAYYENFVKPEFVMTGYDAFLRKYISLVPEKNG